MSWIVRLPASAREALARVRFLPAVEVLAAGDWLWLRGAHWSEELARAIRLLPGAERFDLAADGQLTPHGRRVPAARLPTGDWSALARWALPALPHDMALGDGGDFGDAPAGRVAPARLVLVRSSVERPATHLLLALVAWRDYVLTASQARLAPLRFAASARGEALVTGQPLPPLSGEYFYELGGLILPAGHAYAPAVAPALARRLFCLEDQQQALWRADGAWELLEPEQFVAAGRAAARASVEVWEHGG